MMGLLAADFGYNNRMTLLQQLIDCGDVLLGNQLYGMFLKSLFLLLMLKLSLVRIV